MTLAFPLTSWVVCALCLLIAVVVGAYRHWCKYLWIRTAIVLVANAGDNRPGELRLGAYVPGWKSIKVRVGSWLLVAAFSTLGRGLGGRPTAMFRYRTGQQVLSGHPAHPVAFVRPARQKRGELHPASGPKSSGLRRSWR